MPTDNRFRDYQPNQLLLLPQDMREWLPEDHLAHFVSDVVDELNLSAIVESYDGSCGGQPAYHPRMMVKLLFYAYAIGVPSSRKVERNTYDSVPFRVLAAGAHPDHDTIAEFRRRHLAALAGLFVAVLRLCRKAGLVKLGHVALDGTKVRANASKHKAMSYGRMEVKERELAGEVERLLAEAEAVDAAEDVRYGRGKRGDELPAELRFKRSRLEKIRAAKRALEEEARREAEEGRQSKGGGGGTKGKPAALAQRNFTDPESRIMRDGATKVYVQGYNCQVAVDSECQVIVAAAVTQACNDKEQLVPMVERIRTNSNRRKPRQLSADSGYYSETNVRELQRQRIDPYVATEKQKHGAVEAAPRGRIPKGLSQKERMARKLRTVKGRRVYGKRKEVAEPVLGQIKEARGFRQFRLRGLLKVDAEWLIICLTHNLLKLFRWSWQPALAG
jgi:transposase/IS5 family transposase